MSVINTNITSLIAQSNLNKSQNSLSTAMERLSSGLRINSAKDDAAGQAIANRFSAQINGLNQAQRNANDGISVAQTTEGSLNQINDNLQSIRTLTVQAQNGSNSASDLQSIQDEIDQRLAEINRISEETDFNGTKVLSENAGSLTVQVGANDGQTIEINLREMSAQSMGLNGFNVDGGGEIENAEATVTNVEAAGGTQNPSGGGDYGVVTTHDAATFDDILENMQDGNTVAVSGGATYTYNAAADNFDYTNTDTSVTDAATGRDFAESEGLIPSTGTLSGTYEVAGGDIANFEVDSQGNILVEGEQAYIAANGELSANSGAGAVTATAGALFNELASSGAADTTTITLGGTSYVNSGGAGGAISFADTATSAEVETELDAVGDSTITLGDGLAEASVTYSGVSGGSTDTFVDGDGELTTIESFRTEYNVNADTGEVTIAGVYDSGGTATTNVEGTKYDEEVGATVYVSAGNLTTSETTPGDATEDPLAAIDAALADVDSLRSELGAVQNRFMDAITNLDTNATNLSSARSRIEDADYAVEVANMTRAQILQQAGTSVLAQANQLPQNVLSLLG